MDRVLLLLASSPGFLSGCPELQKLPAAARCDGYTVCRKGLRVFQACPEGELYHPETSSCRDWRTVSCGSYTHVPQAREDCQFIGRPMPMTGDCGRYKQCNTGVKQTVTIEECPFLQNFDPTMGECRFSPLVDCGGTAEECRESERRAIDWCGGFDHCIRGRWYRFGCPEGTGFHYLKGICDPAPECLPTNCTLGDVVGDESSGCRFYLLCVEHDYVAVGCPPLHRFDVAESRCRPMRTLEDGYQERRRGGLINCPLGLAYPAVGICQEYYKCDPYTGRVSRLSCPEGQRFDPDRSECSTDGQAKCRALKPEKFYRN